MTIPKSLAYTAAGILLLLLLAVTYVPSRRAPKPAPRTLNEISIENGKQIFLALGKYRDRNDVYPAELDELVVAKLLKEIPVNPFTGNPVSEIELGREARPGDYSFVTGMWRYYRNGSLVREIPQYLLIVYGEPPGLVTGSLEDGIEMDEIKLSSDTARSIVFYEGSLDTAGPNNEDPDVTWSRDSIGEAVAARRAMKLARGSGTSALQVVSNRRGE